MLIDRACGLGLIATLAQKIAIDLINGEQKRANPGIQNGINVLGLFNINFGINPIGDEIINQGISQILDYSSVFLTMGNSIISPGFSIFSSCFYILNKLGKLAAKVQERDPQKRKSYIAFFDTARIGILIVSAFTLLLSGLNGQSANPL